MYVHLFKYCTHSFEVLGTLVTSYFAYFMLLRANGKKKHVEQSGKPYTAGLQCSSGDGELFIPK